MSAGWTVTSLQGQLDGASLQSREDRLSGSGTWRVEARDELTQTVALQGNLDYSIESVMYRSRGFTVVGGLDAVESAAFNIRGDLTGEGVQVSIETDASLENKDGVLSRRADGTVRLVRNGQENTIRSTSSSERRQIAYNTTAEATTSTVDRDGKKGEGQTRTVTRDLGKGEFETWLTITAYPSDDKSRATTNTQHFFRRMSSRAVAGYLDRFDLQTPDNSYKLKAPAQLIAAADGTVIYDLTVLDAQGKEMHLTATPQPVPPGGNSSEVRGVPGLLSPPTSGSQASALAQGRPAGLAAKCPTCPPAVYVAGAVILGLGVAVLLGGAIGSAAAAIAVGEVEGGLALGGVAVGMGGAYLGGAYNAGRNGIRFVRENRGSRWIRAR